MRQSRPPLQQAEGTAKKGAPSRACRRLLGRYLHPCENAVAPLRPQYRWRVQTLEIVLVRHAESVPPGTPGWEERDEERPLSEKGLRQAYELAFELEPYILTACYVSP